MADRTMSGVGRVLNYEIYKLNLNMKASFKFDGEKSEMNIENDYDKY